MPHSQPDQRKQIIRNSVELLDAMASVKRLAILTLIVEREVSVGKLSDEVGVTQSSLSQHLAKLRGAGLVSARREAQTIYYRCDSPAVKQMMVMLSEIFPGDLGLVSERPAMKRVD